ncbi:hypothetical protein B0T24DRAFT_689965 [Lasiosphaeria ovina]|uniref:Uncharacterized protein n=1 Tax=Lasiosphaeria ovina TaxID=92902 RepID=A0AAE0NN92_9PEZI|nr:hypothetical protein B0T24DRAFT_689965 [Lasiosphaeria ovina]
MDSTSALSLCSDILWFIDTSRKLLAGDYSSQTGLKDESVHIDALIENLRQVTAKLDSGCVDKPNHGIALESIAKNSEKPAKEVLRLLKRQKAPSRRGNRSAADVLKILADYQRLALYQLALMIRDEQSAVGQQLHNLESEASNLCTENATRVSKLKDDLLRAWFRRGRTTRYGSDWSCSSTQRKTEKEGNSEAVPVPVPVPVWMAVAAQYVLHALYQPGSRIPVSREMRALILTATHVDPDKVVFLLETDVGRFLRLAEPAGSGPGEEDQPTARAITLRQFVALFEPAEGGARLLERLDQWKAVWRDQQGKALFAAAVAGNVKTLAKTLLAKSLPRKLGKDGGGADEAETGADGPVSVSGDAGDIRRMFLVGIACEGYLVRGPPFFRVFQIESQRSRNVREFSSNLREPQTIFYA